MSHTSDLKIKFRLVSREKAPKHHRLDCSTTVRFAANVSLFQTVAFDFSG
jgi:uncharacterized protein YfaT (DUF1175 family)